VGSDRVPLNSGAALAVTPAGELLLAKTDGLWQITPAAFTVTPLYDGRLQPPAGGVQATVTDQYIYLLDARKARLLRISL
jgi:hypothetical protein